MPHNVKVDDATYEALKQESKRDARSIVSILARAVEAYLKGKR